MPFWDTVMDSPSDIAYGNRLVPNVVDEIALKDPARVCFSFPLSSPNPQGRYHDVTFRTFANAVNKTAHFIRREIGCSAMFETVMYMGHQDIRHFIILVALMKTGHKVLFSSHRNSVAGHAELIKQSDCGILLYTSGFSVNLLLESCRMESVCIPELDYLLNDDALCDDFPYEKTFEEAKIHPCMVMHTSGTKGLPKPVVWTHWTLAGADTEQLTPPFEGRPTLWGNLLTKTSKRSFSALPMFHGAGLISAVTRACFGHTAIVIGPPGITTADTLARVLDHADIDSAFCDPTPLEEAATRPDIMEKLGRLKYVAYTGGLLSQSAGDAISRVVPLYSVMTSTETAIFTQYATDPEDWQYVFFDLTINGIEMRPHKGNLYELVIKRNAAQADHQAIFKNFPHLDEFSMPDLYEKHPSKPGLWKFVGRKDDISS
ncbi:acetyl-CoA synthetase-like protein [Periconia macrospinosa]|uniref:Acetyl-CoA synthetase-like protein n=1 Tax=Periconia macrospinosa TaxID=97972 RepID=A0A2V1DUZ4_9PLEO|nr:acetyl-CoA synthetase-like protein [Periconia macrospinosa]